MEILCFCFGYVLVGLKLEQTINFTQKITWEVTLGSNGLIIGLGTSGKFSALKLKICF